MRDRNRHFLDVPTTVRSDDLSHKSTARSKDGTFECRGEFRADFQQRCARIFELPFCNRKNCESEIGIFWTFQPRRDPTISRIKVQRGATTELLRSAASIALIFSCGVLGFSSCRFVIEKMRVRNRHFFDVPTTVRSDDLAHKSTARSNDGTFEDHREFRAYFQPRCAWMF